MAVVGGWSAANIALLPPSPMQTKTTRTTTKPVYLLCALSQAYLEVGGEYTAVPAISIQFGLSEIDIGPCVH